MNKEISIIEAVVVDSTNPVTLRPLIANNSQVTQISRRLAHRLGLNAFQSVYVKELGGGILKWKLSLYPILTRFDESNAPSRVTNRLAFTYPVIPTTEGDLYWEMIIGQDIIDQWIMFMHIPGPVIRPTPGPSYEGGIEYMGHNISFARLRHIPVMVNDILEFPCVSSISIERFAWERTKDIIYVMPRRTPTALGVGYGDKVIFQYHYPVILRNELHLLLSGGQEYISRTPIDMAVALIEKNHLNVNIIHEFPCDTIFVNFDISFVLCSWTE